MTRTCHESLQMLTEKKRAPENNTRRRREREQNRSRQNNLKFNFNIGFQQKTDVNKLMLTLTSVLLNKLMLTDLTLISVF